MKTMLRKSILSDFVKSSSDEIESNFNFNSAKNLSVLFEHLWFLRDGLVSGLHPDKKKEGI